MKVWRPTGGQSIPAFDYYMAPGVAKSFCKELKKVLDIRYPECDYGDTEQTESEYLTNQGIYKEVKKYRNEHRLIMNDEGYRFIEGLLRNKYCKTIDSRDIQLVFTQVNKLVEDDVHQAMEAVVHNLNSMHSRAGAQVPFSSLNFGTDTSTEGRMASKYLLIATEEGLGNGETPIFPISIFKLKSGVSYNPEDPNYDLFKLACRVSAKRLFPNFSNLDAPYNFQYYKPGDPNTEVAYMGCVQYDEVIRYTIDGKLYVESIGRAFDRLSNIGYVEDTGVTKFINLEHINSHVEIYDSASNGFVKCKKILMNPNKHNWFRLKFKGGRSLVATADHPLPIVGKGRTFVKDLSVGDKVTISNKYSYGSEKPEFSTNIAWLLGVILCDSSYANNIVISLGIDEMDIVNKIKDAVSEIGGDISIKEQHRDKKGDYLDVNIKLGKKLKEFRLWLTDLFGGIRKIDRQIPVEVFRWSVEYKEAFLAGMMDADGYINHHRDRDSSIDTSCACLGSTNKELALQQFELIQSIGVDAKYYLNNYCFSDDTKIRYLVSFSIEDGIIKHMASEKKISVFESVKASKLSVSNTIEITEITRIDINENSYDVETESDRFDISGIVSHNCRTRVMANVYNPNYERTTGRGNLSFTSINLPRLGIKAKGDVPRFFELLDDMLELVHHQLIARFKIQCRKHPRNFPFLMGQGVWIGSDKLGPDDDMTEILKNGTFTVGFIGLAECLKALIGVHHGESEEAQKLGLEIIGHMRDMADKWSQEEHLNYSLIATPAEGLSGRFIRIDKKKYGIIPGVTDRDYYTNSMHVPVYYPISAFKKIQIEAPYHALCNGGHITYIELDGDPTKNLEAFEKVVRYMHDNGIGYGAINHPVDRDPVCGYQGIIDDVCPRCGRREGEPMTEEMWQKIKGYPSWNDESYCKTCGDPAEEADRVTNWINISEDK